MPALTKSSERAIVSLCTGFVKNYHQLLAVRILLGFTESPYFPGALFLLSTWYTKKELAYRTAFVSPITPERPG